MPMPYSKTVSILQITDLHILPDPGEKMLGIDTEYYFKAVLDQAFAAGNTFDLVLVSGDLAQDPCAASYKRILKTLEKYPVNSVCLPGNHDDYPLMLSLFNSQKISCNKQTLFDDWQLICLNSQIPGRPGGNIGNEELLFLQKCLTEQPDYFALIAVHHHVLPTQSQWMDTMLIENQQEVLNILRNYPQVKAVTTGHIHQVMDRDYQSIRVLGSPATCFQFKPLCSDFTLDLEMPGYRIINLLPDGSIETSVYRLPGLLKELSLDSFGY